MKTRAIEQLIDAGRRADDDLIPAILEIKEIRQIDQILLNESADTWAQIARDLPLQEGAALARALTLVDSFPGLGRGSVAPAIWVFLELERRNYPELPALAEWIAKHGNRNGYLPFGTLAHRGSLLRDLRRRAKLTSLQSSNAKGTGRLRRMVGELEYETSYDAWLNSSLCDAEERQIRARLLEKDSKKREDLDKKVEQLSKEIKSLRLLVVRLQRVKEREDLMQRGASLDVAGRLKLISENSKLPIGIFPEEWASHEESTLALLDISVRRALAPRISKIRKGPWRKVYRALCALDANLQ